MAIQIAGTNVVDNGRNLVNITNASAGAVANTYSIRDGSGHLFAINFNQASANNENPTISQVMVTNGSDNFLRKASINHLVATVSALLPPPPAPGFSVFSIL